MPEKKRSKLDDLFSVTYEELRRLAASVKRSDGSVTLNPTALVNELWLKLAKDYSDLPDSPMHFKRVAARAMRQILIDASRRRTADKRNWGVKAPPELLNILPAGGWLTSGVQLQALDLALNDLAAVNERQALIVELRFFGGLELSEVAAALGLSEATIIRDWRMARAWLEQTLRQKG